MITVLDQCWPSLNGINALTNKTILDSGAVSTYQVCSMQLLTDKKLEVTHSLNRHTCGTYTRSTSGWSVSNLRSYALLKASSFLSVTNCTEEAR